MSENEEKLVNNNFSYILSFLLIIVLFIFIYFYSNFQFIENKEFKNKYIKIENIEFNDLPYSIQYKYQKKEDCKKSSFHSSTNNELEKQIDSLKKSNNSLYNKLNNIPALEDKITLLNEETKALKFKNKELLSKNIKYENKNTSVEEISKNIKLKLKSTYKTLMCTNMQKSKYNMTKECFNNIQKFALNNKDAKYFEVMGMISKDDFLKDDYKSDIIKTGFASKRARVVIWSLREALEFKSKVLPVNYYITSSKNYKGTVIRAYY